MLEASYLDGYAARTREAYAADLRQWFGWLRSHDIEPLSAERRHVQAWAAELRQLGRAAGTIARKLSAVSGFYASAIADDALKANPCAAVRRPKVSQESTRSGLDYDEWSALRAAARAAGPVELALVLLLGLNGLRISEACGIRVAHLRTERKHTVVEIRGKGDKPAAPPLAPSTAAAVQAVIDDRGLGQQDLLLGLDRFTGKRMIVALAKAAGITGKRITPHSLRHTMVTLALEAGVPLHEVQDAARHADPRTTQRYNRARNNLDHHATYALAAYLEGPRDT